MLKWDTIDKAAGRGSVVTCPHSPTVCRRGPTEVTHRQSPKCNMPQSMFWRQKGVYCTMGLGILRVIFLLGDPWKEDLVVFHYQHWLFFYICMSRLPLDLFLYHCPPLWRLSHTGLLTVIQYSQDSSLWFPLPTSFWLLPLFAVLILEISPGLPLSRPSHIWSQRDTSIKLHPTICHCSAPYPAFLFHCN